MAESATSVAAAAYQAFQAATPEAIPALTKEFADLVAAAGNTDVQPHVRVCAVNTIGQHGAQFDKGAVKAALEAIIALLGEEDETKVPQKLTVTAVEAFVAMCKNSDDFVRVAADLCVILIVNKAAFPKAAADAAEAGLKALTDASVVGVVKKYLHLISDEREKDEEEQLGRERAFALNHLQKVLANKAYAEQWTEENQQGLHGYLASVIPTATRYELNALLKSFSKLSSLGDGTFFVDKLVKAKLDTPRLFDALNVVAPFVPRTITHDAVAERLLALLSADAPAAAAPAPAPKKGGKKAAAAAAEAAAAAASAAASEAVDLSTDVNAAVAFAFAARTASAEIAPKVADALFTALDKALPALVESEEPAADEATPVAAPAAEGEAAAETDNASPAAAAPAALVGTAAIDDASAKIPENLSAVEAILIGLTAVAVKNHTYVTEKFSTNANIVARIAQTYAALVNFKKFFTFAAKKQFVDGTPSDEEKRNINRSLAVITNVIALAGPLTTSHLPSSTIIPTWEGKITAAFDVAATRSAGKKTLRDLIDPTGAKAPRRPSGNANQTQKKSEQQLLDGPLATKKARVESHNGRGNNNNNNNRHNNNNRSQSSNNKGGRNNGSKGGRRF